VTEDVLAERDGASKIGPTTGRVPASEADDRIVAFAIAAPLRQPA
jgi:hypothetical protein